MSYFILDTNVYLHYVFFEEVDWGQFLGTKKLVLLIPQTVLHELDDKKFNASNSRVKERAQKVIARLYQCLVDRDVPHSGIHIEAWDRPIEIDFAKEGLNPNSADDRLIAEMLSMCQDVRYRDGLTLVAADLGILLKARSRSISAVLAPEEKRLAPEDERDKEIRELRRNVARLQSVSPSLRIEFADGECNGAVMRAAIGGPLTAESLTDEEVAQLLSHERSRLTYRRPTGSLGLAFGAPSDTEVKRYEVELGEYVGLYETYIRETHRIDALRQSTVQLDFQLINEGTAPATDVDVYLDFPKGIRVLASDELDPPQKPTVPSPPRSLVDYVRSPLTDLGLGWARDMRSGSVDDQDVQDDEDRLRVSYHLETLKHGITYEFSPVYVWLDGSSQRSFQIDYTILVSNLPAAVQGQLHVICTQPLK